MDRIFFGDNQFFGVNHMSEEKARQQLMRFQDINAITDVLYDAYSAGVHGFMCTTHERMIEVCDIIRRDPQKWPDFAVYPGMPYAHKYANAMTEHGPFEAIRQFLPSGNLMDTMMRGGKALFTQDVESVVTLLIDAEMKAFEGMKTPIIFLQNVVTDLILGLGYTDAFRMFSDHVTKKYGAEPGFFSMNLPMLLPALDKAGVKNPIVCANVNKIAFRMAGGIEAYREATQKWPARVIAMSVLASGAIPPREAIEWVCNEPYVESILFGASSRRNIESTVSLIHEADAKKKARAA
jgi:hypothetical protein